LLAGIVHASDGSTLPGFFQSLIIPKACPGCCSSHGGITSSCASSGRVICRDGTVSPSCTCGSCGVPGGPSQPPAPSGPQTGATQFTIVGSPSLSISGSTLSCGITFRSASTARSGDLRLEIWVFETPYTGGALTGYRIFEFPMSPLDAGFQRTQACSGSYRAPPTGSWHVAMVISEYTAGAANDGYAARVYGTSSTALALTGPAANYTALWWNPVESGWGLNLNHQGNTLFGTLFTYSAEGQPVWLVASSLAAQADGSFAGELYSARGPAFDNARWSPIAISPVGQMSVRFSAYNRGSVTYSYEGRTLTKPIETQLFSTRNVCAATTSSRATLTNYQDLWWNPDESGWGINLTHQGNIIFATLFVYNGAQRPVWYVASNMAKQSDGTYVGELYTTIGPPYFQTPWSTVTSNEVGSMSVRFTSGETAVLSYVIDGQEVVKTIRRQVFASPPPACR
jgi:hypothetical protein